MVRIILISQWILFLKIQALFDNLAKRLNATFGSFTFNCSKYLKMVKKSMAQELGLQ